MATQKITRLGLALNAADVELLRRAQARLAAQVGRASYVATVLYGLRLVEAHLGGADDEASLPSGWRPGAPAPPPAGPDRH